MAGSGRSVWVFGRRISLSVVLATACYAAVGSVAASTVTLTVRRAPTAPPLRPEDAVGSCPVTGPEGRKVHLAAQEAKPVEKPDTEAPAENPEGKNSPGCVFCHRGVEPSHPLEHSALNAFGCIGCHGGDGQEKRDKEKAHGARPRFPELWGKNRKEALSGNPERTYTLLNQEDPNWIRFVNPGDLRVAHLTCGASGCHGEKDAVNDRNVVLQVRKSMMTHGGFLFGAALYNNSAYPLKDTHFGESYGLPALRNPKEIDPAKQRFDPHSPHSVPQRVLGTFLDASDEEHKKWRLPTPDETLRYGWLSFLDPLPRWEISQVGNVLRVFERGGSRKGEIGNPFREDEAGRPDVKLSFRGHGTLLRTDPTVLGVQKTRLLDPTLNFLGTNDQPGDFRSSGCSACHNVYANDPDPFHSAQYAQYGNLGRSFSTDAALKDAVKRGESGHPIRHGMTNQIPTSQCITCHVHPGTNMLTTYLGYTWWDNETDGDRMYPQKPFRHTAEERDRIQQRNPEGAALKGKWGDVEFLEKELPKLNATLKHTQFAGFNGHGWVFRGVYKRDRKGTLLDVNDEPVPDTPDRFRPSPAAPGPEAHPEPGAAVHLRDIHLEKGMHCVDCHFRTDSHGDGKLYAEPRSEIAVGCIDCHGTIRERADPTTDDPKAPGGRLYQFRSFTVVDGPSRRRFKKTDEGALIQYSAVNPELKWEVPQVLDSITPGNPHYNRLSRLAKTVQKDGKTWGTVAPEAKLAHTDSNMACYTCHSSWTSSCFGCHLQMTANEKKPQLHFEGGSSRNWTSYNFQTLRDDLYMLGKEGTAAAPKDEKGNAVPRTVPVRSSCAILVSSQNANREWLYYQQQTVSAEGFAGTAFSTYVPHTVRGKETKGCTDCHPAAAGNNNAWLANSYLLGSKAVNFIGRNCWVATGEGFEAVQVAERDEPAAVIGSYLHRLAYPEEYRHHLDRGRVLTGSHEHEGHTLSLQQRGEYVYAAEGPGGLRVYDVANIENKGFSERITTAPVSPLGQKFSVRTRYATAVAAPSTLALDPGRTHRPENQEGKIHPLYAYLYVVDRYEGLILVNAATLLDGNPTNNFLKRALTWNPEGLLNGAGSIQIAGTHAFITCERGLVILDIDDPLHPKVASVVGAPELDHPRAVAVQFRYAFVCDATGLRVVDITDPARARVVPGAHVPFAQANDVYVSRTYAYVAAGRQGLAIVDVERPEQPELEQLFSAGGKLNDARAVRVGMTNNSTYAYVADGENGLRVVQLTSPETTPGIYGYAPRATPTLIATFRTHGPALALSEGQDRDRAVDESGNQLSVFGRRGARPLNAVERRRMMYAEDGQGALLQVRDEPAGPPEGGEGAPPAAPMSGSAAAAFALLPLFGLGVARRRWRVRTLVVALAFLAAWGGAGLAQTITGPHVGFGIGNEREQIDFLSLPPAVRARLRLTPQQKSRIAALQQRVHELYQRAWHTPKAGPKRTELYRKMREAALQGNRDAIALLTPGQARRLAELHAAGKQYTGLGRLGTGLLAVDGITLTQKSALVALAQRTQQRRAVLLQPGGPGAMAQRHRIDTMRALDRETDLEIRKILTPAQQRQYAAAIPPPSGRR